MSLTSPEKRVAGLGAAKAGVSHWWHSRVTSVALVPLSLWFVFALVGLPDYAYLTVRSWIGEGWNAVLLVLFVATLAWHSVLGVQVVIEDYVHHEALKIASLLASSFAHAVFAAAGIFAVFKIALAS